MANDKTSPQMPPKRRGMSTLGQSVNRVTTPAMRRRGFAEATIVTDWPTIVGRPLSDNTRPSRIVFPRGERTGGTLHLVVAGAFAPEVQHLAPQIIERINAHFGYRAVGRMELHHGRLPPPQNSAAAPAEAAEPDEKVAAAIDRVADEPLRAALDRLARAREGARQRNTARAVSPGMPTRLRK